MWCCERRERRRNHKHNHYHHHPHGGIWVYSPNVRGYRFEEEIENEKEINLENIKKLEEEIERIKKRLEEPKK